MLICIPDISGFTKFMSAAEAEISAKVIPALLNQIIYANEIGLRVSEIEGDAVLFFKRGELPSLKQLIDQCTYFYSEFYKQLATLDQKFETSGKPIIKSLGLKIILHFGEEVEAVNIGKHIKLMGEDVVIAHKLLKNTIDKDDYILFSQTLLNQYNTDDLDKRLFWSQLGKGDENYKHIGDVNYAYVDLKPLNSLNSTKY
ncbi:DUF2652 domain-containing protein [Winogradskyella schleiferi]|uniref:DUF2652 domain-containing protein n=1 Tax=Winogradskyella schleiferi TaxID=2686078 RepID=UPI0015B9C43F|nr:DUF2652 domain-containing protein [Winogradskyella schleiferi]